MTGSWFDCDQSVPIGRAFELLADRQRRLLLSYLREQDDPTASVNDLVTALNAGDETPSPKKIRIALVHQHLPKLATTSILDYDDRSETIRYDGHQQINTMLGIATQFNDE